MAIKRFYVENIGEIIVNKRKKSKRINLRVSAGQVRVTQPHWLPFSSGLNFALKNQNWITNQQYRAPQITIYNNQKIGFDHKLSILVGNKISSTVTKDKIILKVPPSNTLNDDTVIVCYKKAVKRALKLQSHKYLEPRLNEISGLHGFNFNHVSFKAMRSRWGSCNSNKNISVNIFLVMTNWELVDYVLVHELAHTKHLHHGQDFWDCVEKIIPDYKKRQKELKNMQLLLRPYQS
jgi:predicted metal-dependent hydrolase